MAKLPGPFQRGSVWWLRVVVPMDLRLGLEGRTKVVRSLNTSDRRQAKRLALHGRADLLLAFERGQVGVPQGVRSSPAVLSSAAASTMSTKASGGGLGLRDVFGRWKAAKRRSTDSEDACQRALDAFEAVAGRPTLTDITRANGADFRAELLKQPLSSKSAHDRLTWVKSLLRFAYRDLEWLDRQPWTGLDIPYKTESPRRPWTPEEVASFFPSPVFTGYTLPAGVDAAGAAAYWIPLLGLFTGARIGELCQLRVADVSTDSAGPVLMISEEAEGARVGKRHARR